MASLKNRAWLFFFALVACSCASARGPQIRLLGAGAEPAGVQRSSVRVGERITGEFDLASVADSRVRVTSYRVTLATPLSYTREGADLLVSEVVPLNTTLFVIPGQMAMIRWSFTVTPEMADRVGPYRLAFEIQELGVTARAQFAVSR